MFGADDFLPCLTWVLLRSNVVTLQQDTDYMMELLDPSQLQGEGKSSLLGGNEEKLFISVVRSDLNASNFSLINQKN